MSDCRFGVSRENYPDPDPDPNHRKRSFIVRLLIVNKLLIESGVTVYGLSYTVLG